MKHLIINFLILLCCFTTSCQEKEKSAPSSVQVKMIPANNTTPYPWSFSCADNMQLPIAEYVRRILQDSRGHLWFGTNSVGLARFNGDTLKYFSTYDGLSGNQITGIIEDKQGNMWFSTTVGISMYDGNKFMNFTERDGLSSNSVWSIYEDSKGTIWAGTTKGLCRYNPETGGNFSKFHLPEVDVPNARPRFSTLLVSSIMEDKKGNLWFGTDGAGVFRYNPSAEKGGSKEFMHISKKDGLCDNSIVCILEDSDNNIWFSSRYGGLSRYNLSAPAASDQNFTSFTVENGKIGNNEVWTMYEDRAGNIWFSSEGYGAYRFKDNQLTNFGENEGFPMKAVQSFYEGKNGLLWIGGGNGLYSYDGKKFSETTRNGFRKGC